MLVNGFVCRSPAEVMGYQPTHNGQFDGYHELAYQQQGVHYPSHMQACSNAGIIALHICYQVLRMHGGRHK